MSGDFGLLHAIDERLAAYGFETNTGVRFVVVVDMLGREVRGGGGAGTGAVGLREGELKVVRILFYVCSWLWSWFWWVWMWEWVC